METLLWALDDISNLKFDKLKIYTDSQNIEKLIARREKLQRSNFQNSKNIELKNAILYRNFFQFYDKFNFSIVKLCGHLKSKDKTKIDEIFSKVDKISRSSLKQYIKESK